MSQPEWKYVCNLGDVSPIDHGGDFLYVDATGVYSPEIEHLVAPADDVFDTPRARWTVYRFSVSPCTFISGRQLWEESKGELLEKWTWDMIAEKGRAAWNQKAILSDNKYHPRHPVWFARPFDPERPQDGRGGLEELSSFIGVTVDELVEMFLSPDARVRARAWLVPASYHALENFDGYPLDLKREEVEKRYEDELRLDSIRRNDHKLFKRVWAHHPRGGRDYGYATEVRKGLYSPERGICPSVESAACGGGISYPDSQVNLADESDPLDPMNKKGE